MKTYAFTLLCALTLPLAACGDSMVLEGGDMEETGTDESSAAESGVVAEINGTPTVHIPSIGGTEVRVSVDLTHLGGPDAETLEIVSGSLDVDLEHHTDLSLYADIDSPEFEGLAEGESFRLRMHGFTEDGDEDFWTLCEPTQSESERVTLNLKLRVAPGANDDEDEFVFESLEVTLTCSDVGPP
jgi:hypothetical protein